MRAGTPPAYCRRRTLAGLDERVLNGSRLPQPRPGTVPGHGCPRRVNVCRKCDDSCTGSRQRALARNARSARKAGRRRRELTQDEETGRTVAEPTAEALRNTGDPIGPSARANPENRGAARTYEREAPLRGDRRRRERFGNRNAVLVGHMLLRPGLHDGRIRRGPPPEKLALPPVCLEQRHLAIRKRVRERDARHAATRANVDERSVERPHELGTAQRVVQQHAASLLEIANRREPWSCNESAEPAVKPLVRVSGPVEGVWGNREVPPARIAHTHTGKTTTKRFGSVPSLDVSTPAKSFNRRWTIFRSTAVIGSSSTGSPLCAARWADRTASASSDAWRRAR